MGWGGTGGGAEKGVRVAMWVAHWRVPGRVGVGGEGGGVGRGKRRRELWVGVWGADRKRRHAYWDVGSGAGIEHGRVAIWQQPCPDAFGQASPWELRAAAGHPLAPARGVAPAPAPVTYTRAPAPPPNARTSDAPLFMEAMARVCGSAICSGGSVPSQALAASASASSLTLDMGVSPTGPSPLKDCGVCACVCVCWWGGTGRGTGRMRGGWGRSGKVVQWHPEQHGRCSFPPCRVPAPSFAPLSPRQAVVQRHPTCTCVMESMEGTWNLLAASRPRSRDIPSYVRRTST